MRLLVRPTHQKPHSLHSIHRGHKLCLRRSRTTIGFVHRIASGKAPKSYVGAAREAAGAVITLGAMWLDNRAAASTAE